MAKIFALFTIILFTIISNISANAIPECSLVEPMYKQWVNSNHWSDNCCELPEIDCDSDGNFIKINISLNNVNEDDLETVKYLADNSEISIKLIEENKELVKRKGGRGGGGGGKSSGKSSGKTGYVGGTGTGTGSSRSGSRRNSKTENIFTILLFALVIILK